MQGHFTCKIAKVTKKGFSLIKMRIFLLWNNLHVYTRRFFLTKQQKKIVTRSCVNVKQASKIRFSSWIVLKNKMNKGKSEVLLNCTFWITTWHAIHPFKILGISHAFLSSEVRIWQGTLSNCVQQNIKIKH